MQWDELPDSSSLNIVFHTLSIQTLFSHLPAPIKLTLIWVKKQNKTNKQQLEHVAKILVP